MDSAGIQAMLKDFMDWIEDKFESWLKEEFKEIEEKLESQASER